MPRRSFVEQQMLSEQVGRFLEEHPAVPPSQVVRHFTAMKEHPTTIWRIIARIKENGSAKLKPRGRRVSITPEHPKVQRVLQAIRANRRLSYRAGAKQTRLTRSTFGRYKVNKLGIPSRVRQKGVKMKNGYAKRQKQGSRFIYRKLMPGRHLFMDDETVVPVDPAEIPAKQFYSWIDGEPADYKYMVKKYEKYTEKRMVWQCLDNDGRVTAPCVFERNVTGEVYLRECIIKILMPFIRRYHKNEKIFLWADLATVHYDKKVLAYFRKHNIKFVPRKKNTPAFCKGRKIERFWALCKIEWAKYPNKPANIQEYRKR